MEYEHGACRHLRECTMSFLGNLGEGSGDVLSKCPDMQSFFIYVGVIKKVLVKKGPLGMHFLQGGS